jgi:hypothetical protein
MRRKKRIALWVAVGLTAVLFFLVLCALLLPMFIRLEPLKERIQEDLSRRLGLELDYRRLHLSLFPHPSVTFDDAVLTLPGKLRGTVASVRLCPAILSFLHGEVRIASVRVRSPHILLTLAEPYTAKERPALSDYLQELTGRIRSATALVERKTPGLRARVQDGSVELNMKGLPVYRFEDLQGSVRLPPGKSAIELTCSSNLWKSLSFQSKWEPQGSEGTGSLSVTGFNPEGIYDLLFSSGSWRLSSSEIDLNLDLETKGPEQIQGTLRGSIPNLTLVKGGEKEVLSADRLEADFALDGKTRKVTLRELELTSPRIRLAGELIVQAGSPQARLSITGEKGDISSLRKTGLVLADRFRITHRIFHIVRGGTIPHIEVDFRGSSVAELGNVRNMTLQGKIEDGEIFLPPLGLKAQEVAAEAVISEAVLKGRDISAIVAGSHVSAGTLEMGLEGADPPFHLDVQTDADLARVPFILSRLLKGTFVEKQASLLQDLQGRALGRVVLEGTLREIRPKVDLSSLHLHARDPRMPWPVDIRAGRASYDEKEISLRNLKGSLGRSAFSRLSVRLPLSASRMQVSAGSSRIVLDEVYPWLRSFQNVKSALGDIESLKGDLLLDSLELHGPVRVPEAWTFEVSGSVKDVVVGTPLLPGDVTLTTGNYEADPEKASLQKAGVAFLDASLEVSGSVNGLLQGLKGADASFQGSVGPRATAYIYELAKVPSDLLVRSPMTVSRAQFSWTNQPETRISAALSVQDGPQVTFDTLFQPEAMVVRNLSVRHQGSEASLTLDIKRREFGASFKGTLTKAILDSLLVTNSFLDGNVEGNFRTHIFLDAPAHSTAEGSLRGTGLLVPGERQPLLKIDDFFLDARTSGLDVNKADLLWRGSHLRLQGAVEFVEKWIRFDTKVSADRLAWEQLRSFVERRGPSQAAKKEGLFWKLPVYGTCEFDTETFTYGDLSWRPLRTDLVLQPEEVSVEVKEALLCGISTPGRVSLSPRSMKLDFTFSSEGRKLGQTLECLVDHRTLASGSFNLDAEVKTTAKEDHAPHLLRSLEGQWRLTARDGRINRFGLLASIFSVLDFTPYLQGKLPDLSTGSFPYHSIDAEGRVEGGKIELTEALIRSSSLQIASQGDVDLVDDRLDLTVLVAPFPFGAADFLVHQIPLLGKVLGASILSFPVSVSGPLSNPTVIPLSPATVASSLLGIMRRAVHLPMTLVEPLLPGAEGEGQNPKKKTASGYTG